MERRFIPPILLGLGVFLTLIILLGPCGSDDATTDLSGATGQTTTAASSALSPRDATFAYVPATAALVTEIRTDAGSDAFTAASMLLTKLPDVGRQLGDLRDRVLGGLGDARALGALGGNPLVAWIQRSRPLRADRLCAAWTATDAGTLQSTVGTATERGQLAAGSTVRGVQLYTASGDGGDRVYAIDGAELVTCPTERELEDALARRRSTRRRTHLTGKAYDARIARLAEDLRAPDEAIATASLSDRVLGLPPVGRRLVPFLDALRGIALAAVPRSDGLHVGFVLATNPDDVIADDLPLSAAADAPLPEAPADTPVVAGIRSPRQLIAFAERVGRALAPDGYGRIQDAIATLKKRTGADVDVDLVAQLLEDATIAYDPERGAFTLTAPVEDPGKAQGVVARLPALGTASPTLQATGEGNGVTAVTVGSTTLRMKVVDETLVVTTDPDLDVDALQDQDLTSPESDASIAPAAQGAVAAFATPDGAGALLAKLLGLGDEARSAIGQAKGAVLSLRGRRGGIQGELVLSTGG